MPNKLENILLIAGSGRNVGKTTLACQILQAEKKKKPIAVKVTPHFHKPTPGLVEIKKGDNWILFEETNTSTQKDSSLYIQNGAAKSFLIQAEKTDLGNAFSSLIEILPKNNLVIIESTALIDIIHPGFFIVVIPDDDFKKKENEPILKLADLIVISDGKMFYPSPNKIVFDKRWRLK